MSDFVFIILSILGVIAVIALITLAVYLWMRPVTALMDAAEAEIEKMKYIERLKRRLTPAGFTILVFIALFALPLLSDWLLSD